MEKNQKQTFDYMYYMYVGPYVGAHKIISGLFAWRGSLLSALFCGALFCYGAIAEIALDSKVLCSIVSNRYVLFNIVSEY